MKCRRWWQGMAIVLFAVAVVVALRGFDSDVPDDVSASPGSSTSASNKDKVRGAGSVRQDIAGDSSSDDVRPPHEVAPGPPLGFAPPPDNGPVPPPEELDASLKPPPESTSQP